MTGGGKNSNLPKQTQEDVNLPKETQENIPKPLSYLDRLKLRLKYLKESSTSKFIIKFYQRIIERYQK